MFIGCSVALVLYIIFFLVTISYHRDFRKQIDKKKNPLFMFYGMAMFIANRLPKKILYGNVKTNRFLAAIQLKEDEKRKQYLYAVKKISISMCLLLFTLISGLGISITDLHRRNHIQELKRDNFKDITYFFTAKTDHGETEEIHLNLQKKEMSQEEIKEFILSKKEKIIKSFLGKNSRTDHISKDVNLISQLSGENIYINWEISDTNVLDYDGKIKGAGQDGTVILITAKLTFRKVTVDYIFPICVYQDEQKQDMGSSLQSYVDQNDKTKNIVKLPKQLKGQSVQYYKNEDKAIYYVFPLGIILSVAMFFLKDKDLKKQMKQRDLQMQSDYPEIVSQVLLYYGAGITLKSAMEKIVAGYLDEQKRKPSRFRYAYEELEIALIKMKSGISEIVATEQFGQRCGLQCYKRFAGLMEQNIKRGTGELIFALKSEVRSAMDYKRHQGLKRGSKMSTKLLGPMVLMLIISIAIIMVPAFMSIQIN